MSKDIEERISIITEGGRKAQKDKHIDKMEMVGRGINRAGGCRKE